MGRMNVRDLFMHGTGEQSESSPLAPCCHWVVPGFCHAAAACGEQRPQKDIESAMSRRSLRCWVAAQRPMNEVRLFHSHGQCGRWILFWWESQLPVRRAKQK